MILNLENSKYHKYIYLAIVSLISLNILFIDYPILGSDEYAYFINAKYIDRLTDLYIAQPHLQHTPTILYLWFLKFIIYFDPQNIVIFYRFLQLILYILIGLILKNQFTSNKLLESKKINIGFLLYLILPSSFYINTVMPEILIMLISALALYLLLGNCNKRKIFTLGLLLGAGLLIKPHVLATILACNLFILLNNYSKVKISHTILNLAILNLTIYLSALIITKLTVNEWDLMLKFGLGSNVYGQYLKLGLSQYLLKLYEFSKYFIAHSLVLALFFTPVFVSIINKYSFLWMEQYKEITLFVVVLLISHISMISWFTAGAGQLSDGEQFRLHGRYLNPVLIFMPFLYILVIDKIGSSKTVVLIGLFQILLLLLFIFIVVQGFKIFPWDYPALFAFFKSQNWYGWKYTDSNNYLSIILILFILMVNILIIIYRNKLKFVKVILITLLSILFIFGLIQTFLWAYSHEKNLANINTEARSIGKLLGAGKIGDGVFITDNPYGTTAFALFNLDSAPKVLIRNQNSDIKQSDIEGAKWVIFMGNYNANFPHKTSISLSKFNLFPLNSNILIETNQNNSLNLNKPLRIYPAKDLFSNSFLVGFNAQEEWGSWTKRENAKVVFPGFFSGNLRLTISGWTLPENLNKSVVITLGSQSKAINFSEKNSLYELDFSVAQPIDSILISSPVLRPKDSGRDMGVAINWIQIENKNASNR